uniref:Uncharacterized protein n=1 Tax=Anguilla anguilla TaxID=7936 RepID=A0A0E9S710_ANGAN
MLMILLMSTQYFVSVNHVVYLFWVSEHLRYVAIHLWQTDL